MCSCSTYPIMNKRYLITGATLINEGRSYIANVLIDNGIISHIEEGELPFDLAGEVDAVRIDGREKWLIPGVIAAVAKGRP